MSILLDAVSKQKQQQNQQQQSPIDMVTQPAPVTAKPKAQLPLAVKQVLGLVVTVSLGGALAWASHTWLLSPKTVETQTNGSQANQTSTAENVEQMAASKQSPLPDNIKSNGSQAESSANVRLAGKVALPVAKHYSTTAISNTRPVQGQVNQPSYQQTLEPSASSIQPSGVGQNVAATYASANQNAQSIAQSQPLEPTYSGITLAQLEALSYQYDVENGLVSTGAANQASQMPDLAANTGVNEQEPIILGANPNERGRKELAKLQYEVDSAAKSVNFEQTKVEQAERNNLMLAFEAALKEVEYEQSANQSVTAEQLDPIPKTQDKVLPSYGDLPASVQLQVPEFNIVAHVYSSEPAQRWLNVDGAELQQGDKIGGKMTIIEIRPRDVILDIDGTEFKVPAI
ncbi:general secretion pathway protein GspB [Shewanella sp. WXL01]|uniref:general secretion pathway protein GspB n=1 Tax=Shewanella sp. WXL01 TaxID=2709721 RepID=UPI001FD944F4|nr:general secretion pathway protein GspB [Shewanella sp. WXL01]